MLPMAVCWYSSWRALESVGVANIEVSWPDGVSNMYAFTAAFCEGVAGRGVLLPGDGQSRVGDRQLRVDLRQVDGGLVVLLGQLRQRLLLRWRIRASTASTWAWVASMAAPVLGLARTGLRRGRGTPAPTASRPTPRR